MALIELSGVERAFAAGEQTVQVLRGIDLCIEAGEMVAIIGQSGSGKSTLMNILGCLDRPSAGSYRFDGRDVHRLADLDLAELRRDHFGFIFQRYQLMAELDAVGNVEIPAIYRGAARRARRERAKALLTRLGLGERLGNKPGALSGGQQQRVSVARALINGGEVILADEPTGALDSASGAELMALLRELHAEGHTVILVTHDPQIAGAADRVIEISDGEITADTRKRPFTASARVETDHPAASGLGALADRLREATRMALKSMSAHKLRSFLTMLGIIIGITSVVSVVALGNGSQQQVLENIASIGTSTIDIRPGTGFGDRRANRVDTLVGGDADALAPLDFAASVSPEVSTSATVIHGGTSASAQVKGVSAGYFQLGAYKLTAGTAFTEADLDARAQVAVLDSDAAQTFFGSESPIGQRVMIGRVPLQVIGVVASSGASFGPQSIKVFTPYTTAMARITGSRTVDSISVQVADGYDMTLAETQITEVLTRRHGKVDFFLTNTDAIRETIQSTSKTLTWLISAIALISLFVGGIGVMNIMLVSVTERTREIGIRKAVGARRSDITAQFLIEAVLVCLIGGALGVALAYGLGAVLGVVAPSMRLVYSGATVAAAFGSATLIGVVFGYLPARSAAKLDPVVALARE
ncbi:MacB family efflux pump subunit [Salipiger mangrovisoli]|uniref:Pyoverdine export ATP-binding/permease protein PvdT n=1 Tax=Salipiger mangrovisoli TaxID=2865933 RepID=A0ABR9X7F9_9RHOB|nr:MacB family efflux pump subunit [Salipiger mangrovisoli]MBE9639397.1 MacB family efflux pump subunit [Salipiger mangrovisoli]